MKPDLNNPLTGAFWQSVENNVLSLCWCDRCNDAVWYPELSCPSCGQATTWKPLSGRATLLSWTVVRRPMNPDFAVPYMPALVLPEEAPHARLVTQMVDCSPDDLRCDMSVKVLFRKLETRSGESYTAPVFTPA